MSAIQIACVAVAGYATVWGLYLLLLPALAKLYKPKARGATETREKEWATIAVIVPVHNAASTITRCIRSIQACSYPMEKVDIYAVADHCTDNTAECAREAGATVFSRDDGPKGKTYTLAWAFDLLTARGVKPDFYLIVDSTAYVDPHFLTAVVECWQRGEDIITSHSRLSPENQKWFARCQGLMLVHRNLQNRAREQLRLSAILEGRGMAYSPAYIEKFGWRLALPTSSFGSTNPDEDWRHGVRLAKQGYRIAFADDALVFTPLRGSLTEATKQGVRWERGRMINAATHAVGAFLHGCWQRDRVQICAALDALQPPVAVLGALGVGSALLSVVALGTSSLGFIGLIPLLLVGLYGLMVALQGHREGIGFATFVWAPGYILWRCITFALAWGFLDRIGVNWRWKGSGGVR